MPYANNQGVQIHFKVEGEGSPLVLHHGFSGSLEDSYDIGLVQALRGKYQLILIDARGHGASDKPHNPEDYKLVLMVADVVAVLDTINVSKAHFCGYSMGGWIGFGIAKYAPERFISLIIGGAEPYQEEALDWQDQSLEVLRKGEEVYITAMEEVFGARMTQKLKAQLLANDRKALIAYLSQRESWDFENILPTITIPCLIFVGENDSTYTGAKKCSEIIPHATFVSLPGLDHIEAAFRTNLTIPHIQTFLAEVSQVQ